MLLWLCCMILAGEEELVVFTHSNGSVILRFRNQNSLQQKVRKVIMRQCHSISMTVAPVLETTLWVIAWMSIAGTNVWVLCTFVPVSYR